MSTDIQLEGLGLASLKPEGEPAIYDLGNHALAGHRFTHWKTCEWTIDFKLNEYSEDALVIRKKKNGMMYCVSRSGQYFQESETTIKKNLKT